VVQADNFHFREEQRPDQWWLWLLVVFAVAGAWAAFILQVVIDIDPDAQLFSDVVAWIVLVIIGIALPLLFFSLKLTVEVSPGKLRVSYPPLLWKTFQPGDISRAYARTYRPVREYGGWGIRWSPRNGRAYNVSGNRGVQLELASGKKLLLGSRKPEELQQAIELFLSRSAE
jgi:hypothetical protein